jgi:hypothetical protein
MFKNSRIELNELAWHYFVDSLSQNFEHYQSISWFREFGWPLFSLSLVWARKPNGEGRLSTLDLLVLTSLDQLFLHKKYYLPLMQNKLSYFGGQQYRVIPFS